MTHSRGSYAAASLAALTLTLSALLLSAHAGDKYGGAALKKGKTMTVDDKLMQAIVDCIGFPFCEGMSLIDAEWQDRVTRTFGEVVVRPQRDFRRRGSGVRVHVLSLREKKRLYARSERTEVLVLTFHQLSAKRVSASVLGGDIGGDSRGILAAGSLGLELEHTSGEWQCTRRGPYANRSEDLCQKPPGHRLAPP